MQVKGGRPSMGSNRSVEPRPTHEATEFVRFCHRRRSVGWPELYDEMCLVASRGLFRGWGPTELGEQGIGFGLFDLPALAGLTAQVVEEEHASRRAGAAVPAGFRITPRSDGTDRVAAAPDVAPTAAVLAASSGETTGATDSHEVDAVTRATVVELEGTEAAAASEAAVASQVRMVPMPVSG
jgi:hypothetical protein